MRKAIILTLLSVLALFACTDRRYPTTLVVADSLCAVNPDSALSLLTQYKDSIQTASKAHRMYYHLLLADAMNKAYVDMTTDSILKEVADYYDRHGSANEQMRAHYLLGCAYRDMGEAPMALQCYQDAVDKADTTNHEHLRILLNVYSQMAELYHLQDLPTNEIECRLTNQRYALKLKDTLRYVRSFELMLKAYYLMGDTDKVISNAEKARDLYLAHRAPEKAAAVCNILINLFVNRGRTVEARQLMDEFENISGLFDSRGHITKGREIYYYIKGEYYLQQHIPDSAEYYFRRLQHKSRSLNDTIGACKGLMDLYQQLGIADSSVRYSQLYAKALDRQSYIRQTETVHRMSQLYDYQRSQKMAAAEKRSADRARFMLAMVLAGVILCLIWFTRYRNNEQKRKQEAIAEYQHNLCTLEIMTEETQQLKQHEEEYKTLIEKKEKEINALELKIGEYQRLHNPLSKVIEKHPVYLRFKGNVAKGSMPSVSEWQQLLHIIEEHLPEFYGCLEQWKPFLTEKEYKLCILVRLHVPPSSMAALLQVVPSYVNKLRIKLLKELFNIEGRASEFDQRIQKMF